MFSALGLKSREEKHYLCERSVKKRIHLNVKNREYCEPMLTSNANVLVVLCKPSNAGLSTSCETLLESNDTQMAMNWLESVKRKNGCEE